jgi:CheY-like chemotaxis protein
MSLETQAKLFDPFFTTKSASRGLGLAVVSGIVRRLNRAIRVVSELNKATTFQILLPCAGAADRAAVDTVDGMDQVAGTSQKATVLVVEDEHPLRLAVTKMLGKAGFGVLEVDNGSDAIELVRANGGAIDVMLLDLTILGAPSHEVLAETVRAGPNMRVILTSAYNEDIANAVLKRTASPRFRSQALSIWLPCENASECPVLESNRVAASVHVWMRILSGS